MSVKSVARGRSRDEILPEVMKAIGENIRMEWLPGDASNRSYARIFDFQGKSKILMVMNEPEAFKSEEITGSELSLRELPFVTVAREFQKSGVRIPEVFFVEARSEFLICEDFGDELLYEKRMQSPALNWYKKALDELAKIQEMKAFFPVSERKFTRELLEWETEHFMEYALLKRGKNVSDTQQAEIRKFLMQLVDSMANSSYQVVHRDFHSKNLMILAEENRVGVIDFQDALLGPSTYDLASLLRDSYVRLKADEEEELLKYFEGVRGSTVDRLLYAQTSLQRNLKAVGRFFYISMVKGKDTHLPFVKPSLLRIFQTLKEIGEMRVLSILEGLLQDEIR